MNRLQWGQARLRLSGDFQETRQNGRQMRPNAEVRRLGCLSTSSHPRLAENCSQGHQGPSPPSLAYELALCWGACPPARESSQRVAGRSRRLSYVREWWSWGDAGRAPRSHSLLSASSLAKGV